MLAIQEPHWTFPTCTPRRFVLFKTQRELFRSDPSSAQGVLKEPNLAKEAAQDLFSAFVAYEKGDLAGVASTAMGFLKKATIGNSAREKTVMTKTSPADVVMFSGSKDTQTS